MKVMTALSALLVLFALIFPVAAAWSSEKKLPEPETDMPPAAEGLFYVEPESGGESDGGTAVRLLKDGEIAELTLEEYLTGALAAEMPASFEPEALKAQAVALRTYYLRKARTGSSAHPEAQICADSTCCAAYRDDEALREKWGESYEANLARITDAVRSTDGLYLAYGGEPALAVFHSSSAGRTEASEEIWSGAEPYLISVESPESAEDVPGYVTSVTVSAGEFRDTVLGKYPDASLEGDISAWVVDPVYSDSGRLSSVLIGGVSVPGTALRTMFGLRSTAVELRAGEDSITMTTTGYGHGVGMSQYGANTMAASGAGFEEILDHYYPGTELRHLEAPSAP